MAPRQIAALEPENISRKTSSGVSKTKERKGKPIMTVFFQRDIERRIVSGKDTNTIAAPLNPIESEPENLFPFTISEKVGDIFSAPPKTILIHACNCLGRWGFGIAVPFKRKYPGAFKIYHNHCLRGSVEKLKGTALLIPPQPGDESYHYIGCLFTSGSVGLAKDQPEMILQNTTASMKDLTMQVVQLPETERGGEMWMPQINSGAFSVKWDRTKAVLEDLSFESPVPKLVIFTKEE